MPHNDDAAKAKKREWYQRNKELVKARNRAYYAEKKQDPEWYAGHLERSRLSGMKPEQRARKVERDRLRYHQKKAEKLTDVT